MGYSYYDDDPDDLFDDTGTIDTDAVRDALNESAHASKRYFDDGSAAEDPFAPRGRRYEAQEPVETYEG